MTRILLADDDPTITGSLEIFLQVEHEVEVACDGSVAYEKLTSNSFGLAILDWDMPKMTGVEVCKKYRANGGNIPVILLTGRAAEDDKEAGFDVGADDYLTKPVSLKELGARVKALLRRAGNSSATSSQTLVEAPRIRVCIACNKQYSAQDPNSETCADDGANTVVVSVEQLVGQIVGSAKIESLLGVGAWSEVYKASHQTTGEPAAIKILHSHLASDPLKVARFNREAEALMQLKHPLIARVYAQMSLPGGRPCLAMEYLEGISLEQYLSKYGPMTLAQAKHLFGQVCDGLAYAHEHGWIHRDLKPSNIYLIKQNGTIIPKILDFGMAKLLAPEGTSAMASLTQTGEVLGTPAYMSPEQCMGSPIDRRCDLYALGCLIYESLSGARAIPGKTAFEAMSNQISRHPDSLNEVRPSLQIGQPLEDAIFRLLAKDPFDRFDTALEFRDILLSVP